MGKGRNKKGITLIGLVITIVVMLILAGVTINLTLGQNGIFTTAQMAAQNYTQSQNQEMAGIDSFTGTVDKVVESIQNNYEIAGTVLKTENNIKYTADGAGNIIPVPVGFSPITTLDQGTRDTGFVIKNDIDGNEFVWVPVGNVANYQRVAWKRDGWTCGQYFDEEDSNKIIREDFTSSAYYWTEDMPEDERISISNYEGYYIGRFETGINGATLSAEETLTGTRYIGGTLVVQANQQVWNYITADKAKSEIANLYNKTEDNVVSKLCSSYAWDTALKFIELQNSAYPTNTKVGGNYNVNSGGTGEIQPTGYFKVNNIYDLGGNAWEWNTEIYSYLTDKNFTIRGGGYKYSDWSCPPAARSVFENKEREEVAFRITLFL